MLCRKFNYTKGITHGGSAFHSDDVFATALCKYFANIENINFEVTRKNEVSEEEINDPNIIIYDIGKLYNPEIGMFDHHQKDVPLRTDGQKFSACGLILEYFGPTYFSQKELLALKNITTLIDYHDNGKLFPTETKPEEIYEFSFFAPTWNENPNLQTEYFEIAVNIALKTIKYETDFVNGINNQSLKSEIETKLSKREQIQKEAKLAAEEIAIQALKTLKNGIITLPQFAPVRDLYASPEFLNAHNISDIFFIVYKGDRDPYTIQIIPKKPNVFDLKIPNGFNIAVKKDDSGKIILPEDITFIHANGFLAACKTFDAAIKLASKTLEIYKKNL